MSWEKIRYTKVYAGITSWKKDKKVNLQQTWVKASTGVGGQTRQRECESSVFLGREAATVTGVCARFWEVATRYGGRAGDRAAGRLGAPPP